MVRITLALAMALTAASSGAQTTDSVDATQPSLTINVDVTASAPRPGLLIPLYGSFTTLTASDAYLIWRILHRGDVEQNPMAQPLTNNGYVWMAAKAVTTAVLIASTEGLRREHPRAALWTMVFVNAGMAWVVWHNERSLGAIR